MTSVVMRDCQLDLVVLLTAIILSYTFTRRISLGI